MTMPIITAKKNKNLTIAETFEDHSNERYVIVSEFARSGHDIACKPSCLYDYEVPCAITWVFDH